MELVQASAGKPVTLQLYNALTDSFRETALVPAAAPDGSGTGCAGVVVRHARFDAAPRLVWHVGAVQPGSPAQHAGLAADTDFVVGSPQVVFAREGDLPQYIAENVDVPLALFVWSTVSCTVRVVCVTPTLWSGPGLFVSQALSHHHSSFHPFLHTHTHTHRLGCDIMIGALHRIPRPATLPSFTLEPPDPAQPLASAPVPAPVPMPVPVPVSPIAYTSSFAPAAPAPAPEPIPDAAPVQTSALLEASDD